jgi:hypothetical protein
LARPSPSEAARTRLSRAAATAERVPADLGLFHQQPHQHVERNDREIVGADGTRRRKPDGVDRDRFVAANQPDADERKHDQRGADGHAGKKQDQHAQHRNQAYVRRPEVAQEIHADVGKNQDGERRQRDPSETRARLCLATGRAPREKPLDMGGRHANEGERRESGTGHHSQLERPDGDGVRALGTRELPDADRLREVGNGPEQDHAEDADTGDGEQQAVEMPRERRARLDHPQDQVGVDHAAGAHDSRQLQKNQAGHAQRDQFRRALDRRVE